MATVTEVFNPAQESTYDVRTGTYTITRHFQINLNPTDAVVLAHAALPNGIPATFTITHPQDSSTVTMVDVARKAVRLNEALSLVSVSYEGHWLGVLYSEFDGGGKSETITADLDTGLGIGPKLEGTTVYTPSATIRVARNASAEDYYLWFEEYLPDLTGAVNENLWEDPVDGIDWPEGSWQYLGGISTQNRDGTHTIIDTFSIDTTKRHKFQWRPYRDTTESVTIDGKQVDRVKRIYGTEVSSKVHKLAATDTTWSFGAAFY